MEVIYSETALADLDYWKRIGNKAIQNKITQLLVAIEQHPFEGIGKPEPLKHSYSGLWSRRITSEHRLVYRQETKDLIRIYSLKGHYKK